MEAIIAQLEDLVCSFTDEDDSSALTRACAQILSGVKDDVVMAFEMMPDNVAFGIYPYVHITERGQMFLNQFGNALEDELPSWQDVRDQDFFKISGEQDFIRSMPDLDEKKAVEILFAIAMVKSNQEER